MSPARLRALQAITKLRRTAAEVVELCDRIIFSTDATAAADLRALPGRVRVLSFRAKRALTALESDGIS